MARLPRITPAGVPVDLVQRGNNRQACYGFEEEQYLLEVYRYIELNPVRAGMVTDPAEYSWSSYQINALGKSSDLCTPHPEYLSLGKTEYDRLKSYRALFSHHVDDILLEEIRSNTNKGMVIGNDYFKQQMTTLTGRRLVPETGGRPIGWRKAKNGI